MDIKRPRIGVMLCGCGHRDGSEIHEATLTLLALNMANADAVCMAPSGAQLVVRNHVTGAEERREKREMILESARIARGDIRYAVQVESSELDGLIIPGGQGAALNLSTFLISGASCNVHPELHKLITEMTAAGKPIGAICIAPATLARSLQQLNISAKLTCGTDPQMAESIEQMGHTHQDCAVTDCVIDQTNRIVTTPAYMSAKSIGEAWEGIKKLVDAVVEMA